MNTSVSEALAEYRARLHPDEPKKAGAAPWRTWLLVGMTALILLGGLLAWLRPADHAQPTAPAHPSGDSHIVDMTGALPAPDPTPTRAAAARTTAPLVVAPVTAWRPWSSTAVSTWLPTSSVGPRDPRFGRLAGFARNPEGALLAAANVYPAIYYTRDLEDWRSLADRRVQWSDGAREALWAALDPVWPMVTSEVALRPVGFRMLSFTPELSRVRLWWRAESPGKAPAVVGAIATVRWADGDWWLVFDEPASDTRTLDPARDGYVPWGPEGAP